MDLLTLRAEIISALDGQIGTYTLANGHETTAISTRREGEAMIPGTRVTGLEVVILAEPRLVPISAYSQQEALSEWSVFLVGWDDTANPKLAAESLVFAFPGTEWERILVPQGVGPANQARVIIRQAGSVDALAAIGAMISGGLPKSFTIPDPFEWASDAEGFGIARAQSDTTIRAVYAVIAGSGSVTFELRYGPDRSSAGTLATVSTLVNNTTVGQSVTVQNQPVPQGSYVWAVITAVDGAPSRLEVTLET
jgi:hypothetical protein